MLNDQITAGLLARAGYSQPIVTPLPFVSDDGVADFRHIRGWVAEAHKGESRAATLGSSPDDAVRKLVTMISRP